MLMKISQRCPAVFPSALILLLSASAVVFAAGGTIKGRVLDDAGRPLVDVTVTLKNETLDKTYAMKTDKNGEYYLAGITPADYRLKFEKEGFRTLEGLVSISRSKENVFNTALTREVKKPDKPVWEEKNLRAHELYQQGKYDEALAIYKGIIAGDPNVAFIHFNAGNCYYHLQDYEAAAQSFREAVRLKPDFFEAYTNLANALGRLKKPEEAIPLLENAIRSYPANGVLFSSLGLLYLNAGQNAKGLQCLEKAVAIDPKNPAGYHSLGIGYAQIGDPVRAIESYEKYISLISDAKEIERVKGVIEQLRTRIKKRP
jgi:tetratricopeptide (TPR) repeat protein